MSAHSQPSKRIAFISPRFDGNRKKLKPVLPEYQQKNIDNFLALIRKSHLKLVKTQCPCGASSASTVIASTDRYGLPLETVVCETCGTVRFDPYFDAPSIDRFYTDIYQGLYARCTDLNAYFSRQKLYGRKILSYLIGRQTLGQHVFEIGCGAGGALQSFQSAGWTCSGCDYDSRLVAHAQAHGLCGVRQGSLGESLVRLGEESCDVIFSHHVFEHVRNPVEMLETAAKMLKPGGIMLHIVPDIMNIDQTEFPAGDAMQYLHVAHAFNYTRLGLQHLAGRVGRNALSVQPPKIPTPWSHAAEMWIEFPSANSAEVMPQEPQSGLIVCNYLRRTEFRYQYGLCRPQWRKVFRGPKSLLRRGLNALKRSIVPLKY